MQFLAAKNHMVKGELACLRIERALGEATVDGIPGALDLQDLRVRPKRLVRQQLRNQRRQTGVVLVGEDPFGMFTRETDVMT